MYKSFFVGYRIYQSSEDAFSLKAWLTTDPNKFSKDELWNSGDLLQWNKNYQRVERILRNRGLSFEDLTVLPRKIQGLPEEIQKWMIFVKV